MHSGRAGLLGYLRICVDEHTVVESKPDRQARAKASRRTMVLGCLPRAGGQAPMATYAVPTMARMCLSPSRATCL